jgi:hypothetical protein
MKARHLGAISIAPLLSMGLLVGMVGQTSRHIKPRDVEPFHKRAYAEIASYPYYVGTWVGQEEEVTQAAVQLLRPNIILSRRYTNTSGQGAAPHGSFQMLIVQCRDSRDMLGHYPPVCYPAHGQTLISETPRDWIVGDLTITGTEYAFSYRDAEQGIIKRVVYNFLIIPGRGIARNMNAVMSAAEDYQERYYGAAQFQLVFSGRLSQKDRDSILQQVVGARPDIIKALMAGGIHEK